MRVCLRWAERPEGIVGRAYDEASDLVRAWMDSRNAEVVVGVDGWSAVSLAEMIAGKLLSERGYDDALLEAAIDGDWPKGWSPGDLDAELERTRTH